MTPLRFLLSNDDGIDAPGLAALENAVQQLGRRVVIAPREVHSGCGHRVTTHRPLELAEVGHGRFVLDGTPVDCVRVGLTHQTPQADWVVAGINAGANLGVDVYHSGTVAIAREAALLGRPAIAISHYVASRNPISWLAASRWTAEIIRDLTSQPYTPGTYWNVNLPHCERTEDMPEVVFLPIDPSPLPVYYEVEDGRLHYRAVYQERLRREGFDVAACFAGRITITQMSVLRGD